MSFLSTVLADNPTALWLLNEAVGTVASDASANGHGATINGGVTLAQTGTITGLNAMTLNGTSGYLQALYAAALNPATWTLEGWFEPTAGQGAARTLMTCLSGSLGFRLYLNTSNHYVCAINGGSVDGGVDTLSGWTHIVATYDGTNLAIYVNGSLVVASALAFSVGTSANLQFGADNGGGSYFTGSMQGLALYPTALSAARIQIHYLAGLALLPVAGVITNVGLTRGASLIIADAQNGQCAVGLAAGTLASALTSGQAYTSLTLAAGVPAAGIAAGQALTLINGTQTQPIVTSGSAAGGATTIPVLSFVANANYAIGSGVVNTPSINDTQLQNEAFRTPTSTVVAGANPGEILFSTYLSSAFGFSGTQYLEAAFFGGDATSTPGSGTMLARGIFWFVGGTATAIQLDSTL